MIKNWRKIFKRYNDDELRLINHMLNCVVPILACFCGLYGNFCVVQSISLRIIMLIWFIFYLVFKKRLSIYFQSIKSFSSNCKLNLQKYSFKFLRILASEFCSLNISIYFCTSLKITPR